MAINKKDADLVKSMLSPGEKVALTVRQRKFGPGGTLIAPTSVIVTDKRIIIVNRTALGIKKDYENIIYSRVTSVRLEHGIMSSSVFVRVEGYDTDKGLLAGSGKQEGEIEGLRNDEAKFLVEFINNKITEANTTGEDVHEIEKPKKDAHIFCRKCGAPLELDSKFCSKCGAKVK